LPASASPAARAGGPLATAAARQDADEQYRYFSALCDNKHFELAIREGRGFLAAFPNHPKAETARYRLAGALFESGNWSEAAPEYERLSASRAFEFLPEVHFRLGQCRQRAEDFVRAAQSFEAARESGKDYLRRPATYFLAECHFARADWPRAEALYAELCAAENTAPDAEYRREAALAWAWCALRQSHWDAAAERAEAYLSEQRSGATRGEAAFLAGEAHLSAGRPERALVSYALVEEGPQLESALRGTGFALASLGRQAEAARAFEQLLERFPEGRHAAEAALQRGVAWLQAGESARAAAALEDPRAGTGDEASLWLARAQLAAGNPPAALAAAERGLSAGPEGERAQRLRALRGDALKAMGRSDEALASYTAAGSEYALHAASVAALNAGQHGPAIEAARALLERFPSSTRRNAVRLILGEALLAAGEHAQAARELESLASVEQEFPERARCLERLGWALYLGGEPRRAAQAFAQVVERFPNSEEAPEAQYMRGAALERDGDGAGARAAYESYLDGQPNGPRAGPAALALLRLEPGDKGAERMERILAASSGQESWHGESYMALGEYYQSQKQGELAARSFERALAALGGELEQSAARAAAHYALGWTHFEAGRWDRARAEAGAALAEPQISAALRASAQELLAFACARGGDAAAAAQAWRGLAQLEVDGDKLLAALRAVLEPLRAAGERASGLELCRTLVASARESSVRGAAAIEAGWLQLESGDPAAAEACAGNEESAAGARGELLFFTAEKRYEAKEWAAATALYQRAGELAELGQRGDVAEKAHYKRGFALVQQNEWTAAAAAFQRVVELRPDGELFGESLYLVGECRFRAGDMPGAAAALAQCPERAPAHASLPKALHRLVVAQGTLGRWAECEQSLALLAHTLQERRDSAPPFAGEIDLWQGRVSAQRGDARAARAAFERALAREKGQIAAQARLELGKLSLAAGQAEDALNEFLKVSLLFEDGPEVAEALWGAGQCLEALGEKKRAVEQYKSLCARFQESAQAKLARERLAALEQV
jgi:TolA-binding protein